MSAQLRSQIIQSRPIGPWLDNFRNLFSSVCEDVGIPVSSQVLGQVENKETRRLFVALVSALQTLPAVFDLPSGHRGRHLLDDLSKLMTTVIADDFDVERLVPLLEAVLRKEPDDVIWNKVYAAVTELTPPLSTHLPTTVVVSQLEIIKSHPIGERLDGFRNAHGVSPLDDGSQEVNNEGLKDTLLDLIFALQALPASRNLPSKKRSKNLLHDLINLSLAVNSDLIDTVRVEPILDAVLSKQPDGLIWDTVYEAMTASASPPGTLSSFPHASWSHNISSLEDSTQHRKHVDVPNEMQSISISVSPLSCLFLQLPPEIRCMIYRILLRSERHVRMIPPPQDEYHFPCPNNLYSSVLGTCRLIYQEAHYVLYGENSFLAHRINEDNPNAAVIRRAKYRIGLHKREDGEGEARKLAELLDFQKDLRFIELEFGFDLIEDPSIYDLVRQAVQGHRHLMDLKILSPLVFSKIGWRHSWRLWRIVRDQAVLLEWLGEKLVK